MTAVAWFLLVALLAAIALALLFFVKWQDAQARMHKAEKELAQSGSSQDMEDRFKLVSQEVLDRQEEKAAKQINNMIDPVRKEVGDFRDRIEEYIKESRSTKDILNEKFSSMDQSVSALSSEAKELADALRGDAKLRGDWGETVLRKLLELSGLREGESFTLQESIATEDGRLRPDAVVKLPEGREIVIDSKVSLVAYQDYHRATDDAQRASALKSLRDAIERQVAETAKYNSAGKLDTPGFAFMFTPIEPAWVLVSSEFPELIEQAQRKGVIIVGPTNLLAALKVVDHMWSAEQKHQNLREILKQAEEIVNATARVFERLDVVRDRIQSAAKSVDDLGTALQGRRSVLSYAKRLKDYGVRGKKDLPEGIGPGPDPEKTEIEAGERPDEGQ